MTHNGENDEHARKREQGRERVRLPSLGDVLREPEIATTTTSTGRQRANVAGSGNGGGVDMTWSWDVKLPPVNALNSNSNSSRGLGLHDNDNDDDDDDERNNNNGYRRNSVAAPMSFSKATGVGARSRLGGPAFMPERESDTFDRDAQWQRAHGIGLGFGYGQHSRRASAPQLFGRPEFASPSSASSRVRSSNLNHEFDVPRPGTSSSQYSYSDDQEDSVPSSSVPSPNLPPARVYSMSPPQSAPSPPSTSRNPPKPITTARRTHVKALSLPAHHHHHHPVYDSDLDSGPATAVPPSTSTPTISSSSFRITTTTSTTGPAPEFRPSGGMTAERIAALSQEALTPHEATLLQKQVAKARAAGGKIPRQLNLAVLARSVFIACKRDGIVPPHVPETHWTTYLSGGMTEYDLLKNVTGEQNAYWQHRCDVLHAHHRATFPSYQFAPKHLSREQKLARLDKTNARRARIGKAPLPPPQPRLGSSGTGEGRGEGMVESEDDELQEMELDEEPVTVNTIPRVSSSSSASAARSTVPPVPPRSSSHPSLNLNHNHTLGNSIGHSHSHSHRHSQMTPTASRPMFWTTTRNDRNDRQVSPTSSASDSDAP
ncbi:hypothetical protein BKA62DRAFT_723587 [Auriculariales sp. MPI-PUGE-AT-0066]|nr:hypothetical protein BKA62DRAFT_723587 [Auriculariales sp. MPI-PUGE-AT-0066]